MTPRTRTPTVRFGVGKGRQATSFNAKTQVGGVRWVILGIRVAAAAAALVRLARAGRRAAPLAPAPAHTDTDTPVITVIIPARDEAARIEPCLRAVVGAPGVHEVIVVDDESSDATAAIAERLGARVITGRPLPDGWVGKPWALQQGLDAATTEWVVTLDADTQPDATLPRAIVARATADGWDLLSAGARFICPTPALRWLHPAMLTTLVYRFGPVGARHRPAPARVLANGQCMAFRPSALAGIGGFSTTGSHLTDDIALARHLATLGWNVGFVDATAMVSVRMHESAGDAWRNWGRSLPMTDVTSVPWRVADLTVIWLAQALPLPRLLLRRADALDVVLLAARLGTLAGVAPAYDRASRRLALWLSPLADVPVAALMTKGALHPGRTWRGRRY